MTTEQTILFTVMPRGISINRDPLPLSVFIAPRLGGADKLGAFADWLRWTRNLKEAGLELELRCGANTFTTAIDPTPLRPELWEQLFNEGTLVRSHTFDDYTDRGMISFSVRQSLSAIKSIYQNASVNLALPEKPEDHGRDNEIGNRAFLRDLVNGLQVNWNGDAARNWREAVRRMNTSDRFAYSQQALSGPLDQEGLITSETSPGALAKIAIPFAVFHHMPTPTLHDHPLEIDTANVLDFHQALSSLNTYPDLLRALGIVCDLEVPQGFATQTAPGSFGTISVTRAKRRWALAPKVPVMETAYVHAVQDGERRFFGVPSALNNPQAALSVVGLLDLDPEQFGLAQVDIDGGMHKTIMLAETLHNPGDRNLDKQAQPEVAQHPEVFDPEATLPSLRSGGFSLFADRRGAQLLESLHQSKAFNDALKSGGANHPTFFAEDLVRGYRLDVWDSRTKAWHSLHLRRGDYQIGQEPFKTEKEEGFVQLAVMQPAKDAKPVTNDLYLHEAIARWAGWSLSVPRPSKHLSRYANPKDAVPRDNEPEKFAEDQPDTPFKLTVDYHLLPNSLPRLRFGTRYRFRARAVDLAGNGLNFDDPLAEKLSVVAALPRDSEGFAYLRFEPVGAPLVILHDARAVTSPGSAVDRIVIRTFNDDISKDTAAADTIAADRHIVPPRTSVEMGERLGMFDDAAGKMKGDAGTWSLIVARDAGEFKKASINVAGKTDEYPLEPGDRIDELPQLPDPLSRAAAIRDLPGTPPASIGKAAEGAAGPVSYNVLSDPNPRPGSATIISFGSDGWEKLRGFRFSLVEPAANQENLAPSWDPDGRVLTVYLPKGETKVVPLTSYLSPEDLRLMGVWQWLREYIERITVADPQPQFLNPGADVDRIAHVLQRAVEGGHWMLSPPRLLTLVHAVQQPVGRPEFTGLNLDHEPDSPYLIALQSAPDRGRKDPTELAAMTAWRRPGATDAFLIGALKVHGASTAKIDLEATWSDPIDDVSQPKWTTTHQSSHVDELRLLGLAEGYLLAPGKEFRPVGYYDPEHDQIAFVRESDATGTSGLNKIVFQQAGPRHLFNDSKRHIANYTAIASSRFREYFAQDQALDFTRSSEGITVDVPASARPLAPDVAYVIPTFGWQRQNDTNLKRSVRFGGGLRVYLRRPWFSSGAGELLGVALWSYTNGSLDKNNRDKFKPFITQWGMDPIWQTASLYAAPSIGNFPDALEQDSDVSLEESSARNAKHQPGRIDVIGFEPQFDESSQLWYADLTINTGSETYMPFVRLALVRYQPHALADAKVSRVVLADFVQLTPDRSAIVTADPYHSRTIRAVISGPAPRGPVPNVAALAPAVNAPTKITVIVQQKDASVASDLNWKEVSSDVATVHVDIDRAASAASDIMLWSGTIKFTADPSPGEFRLLITEREYISADYAELIRPPGEALPAIFAAPGRIIYSEIVDFDVALLGSP